MSRKIINILFISVIFCMCLSFSAFSSSFSDQDKTQCGSDCSSCHVLKFDTDKLQEKHETLKTCIRCHNTKEQKMQKDVTDTQALLDVPSFDHSGCGGHCNDCHETFPPDGNHVELETCKDCHQ